jgi:hypothetical protein
MAAALPCAPSRDLRCRTRVKIFDMTSEEDATSPASRQRTPLEHMVQICNISSLPYNSRSHEIDGRGLQQATRASPVPDRLAKCKRRGTSRCIRPAEGVSRRIDCAVNRVVFDRDDVPGVTGTTTFWRRVHAWQYAQAPSCRGAVTSLDSRLRVRTTACADRNSRNNNRV